MKYNITIKSDNLLVYEQSVNTLDITKIIAVVNSIPSFTYPAVVTGVEPKRTNLITTNPNQHGSINC